MVRKWPRQKKSFPPWAHAARHTVVLAGVENAARHIRAPARAPTAGASAAPPMNAPEAVANAARRIRVRARVPTARASVVPPMTAPEAVENAARHTRVRAIEI